MRNDIALSGMMCRMPGARKLPQNDVERAAIRVLHHSCIRLGVTQTQLAHGIGISPAQLSLIIRGQKPMTVTELLSACHYLDLSPADVMEQAVERVAQQATRDATV